GEISALLTAVAPPLRRMPFLDHEVVGKVNHFTWFRFQVGGRRAVEHPQACRAGIDAIVECSKEPRSPLKHAHMSAMSRDTKCSGAKRRLAKCLLATSLA